MCLRCEDCHSIYTVVQRAFCREAGHVGCYDDEEGEY